MGKSTCLRQLFWFSFDNIIINFLLAEPPTFLSQTLYYRNIDTPAPGPNIGSSSINQSITFSPLRTVHDMSKEVTRD